MISTVLQWLVVLGFRAGRASGLGRVPFARRAWNRVWDWSRPHGMVLRRIHGSQMYVNSEDPGIGAPILLGVFEPLETVLFQNVVRSGMVVLDVGANIGYYSLLAANRVGPAGRVYALEPNPITFQVLINNVTLNGYEHIVALNVCASDRSGNVLFEPNAASPGESAMGGPAATASAAAISAVARPLDELVPVCDVIKMDIEGAEGLALAGARRLISDCRPYVFFEFAPVLLERMRSAPHQILSALRSHGYSLYIIDEKNECLRVATDNELLEFGANLFCDPGGRLPLRELGVRLTSAQ